MSAPEGLAKTGRSSDWTGILGQGAALVAVLASLAYVAVYMRAMATTSLWNDELFTILNHSGKGPASVLTDYSSNSHLLINLVNSILPERTSFQPLRARAVSFVAVAAVLSGLAFFFWRRKLVLSGAAVVAATALNSNLLDLCLQARGYGLALFFGLWASAAFLAAYEDPSRRNLLFLGAASVLGCFSLVTFGFWAGPLWGILVMAHRSREVLLAAAVAAVSVLLLHAGVLDQMIALQLSGYGERFGYQYGTWASVAETIRLFVLGAAGSLGPRADGVAAGAVVSLLIVLMLSDEETRRLTRASRALLLSAAFFLVICLILRTPLVRTTSFIAMPALIGVAVATGPLVEARRGLRASLAILLLVSAGVSALRVQRFQFVPIETWKETGTWIERILPAGLPVRVSVATDYLAGYVGPGRLTMDFDENVFLSGRLAVAETPMIESEIRDIPGVTSPSLIHLRFAQRRLGAQVLHVAPPPGTGLELPPGLADRNARDCALRDPGILRIPFPSQARFRSLVLVDSAGKMPEFARVLSHGQEREGVWELHQDGISLYGLGDREIDSVEIRMPPGSCLAEVWAYPVAFSQVRD